MKVREIDIPDNRPFIVRVADYKPSRDFNPPMTLGKPRGKTEEAKKVMAMDTCIKNVLSGFRNELNNCGTPMFVGYGMLSSISQEALIRAGVETIADEMTRKFVKFRYDVDDGHDNHEQEISDLEEEAAKYKIKDIFNDAAQKDGYFGGCLVYIDVGELDDEEALEPLVLDKKTFKKGMLKGFKVIEPINIYPGEYNTTDPTDEHYFNPEYWYILGRRYHASRFLYFVGNSVPILLKPAYNFFGIARAQLALDYIAHFVENRESAQELLNKFSLTCWKTDMSQVLAGESCNDLVKRVRMFNKMKSNNGTLVVDKEQEDIMQINTPLGGVRDIVDMSLSLLTAVWRIPKIKYIGEGEGGLNASSKEQMRSFYDFILSQKEKMFTAPMETVLKILQLNMGKDINESIGFEFPSLVEMDDSEIANLNKLKADTAVQLINAGVVSQEEVRQNLSMDKNSGFSMIDVDDIPEEPEQPNEKEVVEVEDEDLITDEFIESEHPRDDDGKFTKSSSSKNAIVMTEKQWEEYSKKKANKGYPVGIGKTLSIVKKNKYGGKELHTDGEFYGKNLRSALSKFIKNSPKEVSQWNYLLEDSSDKELEEFLNDEQIDTDADYIRGEHIREEENGKSLYYFWTKNSIDGTVEDEDLAYDEEKEPKEWITVNGTHIPLFEGQTKKNSVEKFLDKKTEENTKKKASKDDILTAETKLRSASYTAYNTLKSIKENGWYNKDGVKYVISDLSEALNRYNELDIEDMPEEKAKTISKTSKEVKNLKELLDTEFNDKNEIADRMISIINNLASDFIGIDYKKNIKGYILEQKKNQEQDTSKNKDFSNSNALKFSNEKDIDDFSNQQSHKKWEESLSDSEKETIGIYTKAGYSEINNTLRDGKLKTNQRVKNTVDELDAIIDRYNLEKGIVVRRGLNTDVDVDLLEVGDYFVDDGYMSTTLSNPKDMYNYSIEIYVPKGKGNGAYIANQSGFGKKEYEFLVKRGAKVKIISKEIGKDGKISLKGEIVNE